MSLASDMVWSADNLYLVTSVSKWFAFVLYYKIDHFETEPTIYDSQGHGSSGQRQGFVVSQIFANPGRPETLESGNL